MFVLFAILMVICWLGMAVGAIWILVIAGKEGGIHVVLCLLIPFYSLYYTFTRLEYTGIPAAIYGVSLVLLLVFSSAMGATVGSDTAELDEGNWYDPPVVAQGDYDPSSEVMPDDESGDDQEAMPDESMDAEVEPTPDEPSPDESPEPTLDEPDPDSEPTPDEPTPDPEPEPEPTVVEIPEPTFPEGLKGDAQRAFYRGRTEEGNRFLMAALIASDDEQQWNSVRYSTALGRPVAGLRWGIGLQKVDKVPSHVMMQLQRMQQDNGGGNGDGDLQEPQLESPDEDGDGEANLLQRPRTESVPPELREFTGDIGERVMAALPANGLERVLGPLPDGRAWGKQIEYVGMGEELRQVVSLGQQRGVDVLAVAVVTIALKGRIIDATLSVRLVDIATEKRLWTAPTLSSNQVKIAMSRGKDPASEMLAELAEYLEKNFQLQERPDLDKAKVRERLDQVVRDDIVNPLPLLFELRYYQQRGTLTAKEAMPYYRKLLGLEDAEPMASGTPEQRERLLTRYLPMPTN